MTDTNAHTCSERVQFDSSDSPWGFDTQSCRRPATHTYRWRNIGLNEMAYKCDEHAPAFEQRLTNEAIRWERVNDTGPL